MVHSWVRLAAPPIPPAENSYRLDLGFFSFANPNDGYEVSPPLTSGALTPLAEELFATTNGGKSWRPLRIVSGTAFQAFGPVVASSSGVYAVVARCIHYRCDNYRLARSAPGALHWTTTAIPDTAQLGGAQIGLTVEGHNVLLNFGLSGRQELLVSSYGQRPFTARSVPSLEGVTACGLAPLGGSVWATCPTGMMDSYFHTQRLTGPYRVIWTYPELGGGGLVPVTGTIAYRFTGVASEGPPKIPGDVLQRSTNAGRSFADVGPWPFARQVEDQPQFLFLNEQDGFGLGPTPADKARLEVVETSDGGRHWAEVLP